MRTVSFTEALNDLGSGLDNAIVINRYDSKDVVVMSPDHYNSLIETVHLLGSPNNAA